MTKEEIDALGHSLAFDYCESVIDGHSLRAETADDEWFDVEGQEGLMVDELRYLEARGLLVRHPGHDTWVQLRDESEATA